MKKFLIVMLLVFVFMISNVNAGLMVTEGSATLTFLGKKQVCGFCVFATQDDVYYTVAMSNNLKRFVDTISPSGFTLKSIDPTCPTEGGARRQCIANLCNSGNSSQAKRICVTFKGDFELSGLDLCNGLPCVKPVVYDGSIRSIGLLGQSSVTEPIAFSITYYPFSSWMIIYAVIIVIVALIVVVVIKRRKKKTQTIGYCSQCDIEYSTPEGFCHRCGQKLEKKEKK